MKTITLAHQVDWDGWRTAARTLALDQTPPDQIIWSVGTPNDLFADGAREAPAPSGAFTLPRSLVALAETVIQSSDPDRFTRLYRLIWRAHRGEKHILEIPTDPDVHAAQELAKSVRRDTHKMRAFVRFREVPDPEGLKYVSWFEPDHYIVEANAAFFVRRFATMVWSILTPYRSVHWTGDALEFAAGANRADLPDDDRLEAYWRTYYSSIFNPARLKIGAMTSEMPKKYWKNLPEAAAIPDLIRTATARTESMVNHPVISPPKPLPKNLPPLEPSPSGRGPVLEPSPSGRGPLLEPSPSGRGPLLEPSPSGRGQGEGTSPSQTLTTLAREAATCRRCPLWQPATQVVFGEGPADARIMMIGEQPGDQEDLAGRPFVGPAGQLLDRAMAEAGLDRATIYVTNAVKHFKFEPRGKRRIHAKPGTGEITACRFWLDLERAEIKPAFTVMLGASAAHAVLGRTVTISKERGRPIALDGNSQGYVTVHPSYLLRLPDPEAKALEYAKFVDDLRNIKALAA